SRRCLAYRRATGRADGNGARCGCGRRSHDFARIRAAEQGADTVRFAITSLDDISLDESVDAVIGRRTLMHLPDPAETLRRLAAKVRPGGLVAFCESDASMVRTFPDLPLW